MTIPDPDNWKPLDPSEIQSHLGPFRRWCLCGGRSLDWLLGRTTRVHADTDIGVLRSDVVECLTCFGQDRVFLCDPPGGGGFVPWTGGAIPSRVHDIWIADASSRHWMLQVMVYDNENGTISYRRDRRVRWSSRSHSFEWRGIQVLNPVISLLFKLNRPQLDEKDCADIMTLIDEFANRAISRPQGHPKTDLETGSADGTPASPDNGKTLPARP